MKRSSERTKPVCAIDTACFISVTVFTLIKFKMNSVKEFGHFLFLCIFFHVCTAEQKTEIPDEPPEEKSQQKSQGMRKSKKRAKLIIRNLSFKASDYDEVKACEA